MGRETPMTELAPHQRPKRFPGLVAWLLVLLILLAVVGAWFAFHPGFRWGQSGAHWAAAMPEGEFERRVRAYLLEHPEVIAEAISRLESQQGAQDAADASGAEVARRRNLSRSRQPGRRQSGRRCHARRVLRLQLPLLPADGAGDGASGERGSPATHRLQRDPDPRTQFQACGQGRACNP